LRLSLCQECTGANQVTRTREHVPYMSFCFQPYVNQKLQKVENDSGYASVQKRCILQTLQIILGVFLCMLTGKIHRNAAGMRYLQVLHPRSFFLMQPPQHLHLHLLHHYLCTVSLLSASIVQAKTAAPGLGFSTCRMQAKYGLLKHVQFDKVGDRKLKTEH